MNQTAGAETGAPCAIDKPRPFKQAHRSIPASLSCSRHSKSLMRPSISDLFLFRSRFHRFCSYRRSEPNRIAWRSSSLAWSSRLTDHRTPVASSFIPTGAMTPTIATMTTPTPHSFMFHLSKLRRCVSWQFVISCYCQFVPPEKKLIMAITISLTARIPETIYAVLAWGWVSTRR